MTRPVMTRRVGYTSAILLNQTVERKFQIVINPHLLLNSPEHAELRKLPRSDPLGE